MATVPLVSHFCPSDTYKFYKKVQRAPSVRMCGRASDAPLRSPAQTLVAGLQGSSMRVDTTLVGFENLKWLRGNISYMFYPDGQGTAPACADQACTCAD